MARLSWDISGDIVIFLANNLGQCLDMHHREKKMKNRVNLGAEFAGGADQSDPVVLVVDDIDDIRESSAMLLQHLYKFSTVYTAADGASALKILADHSVDVIVSDINMPGMDGFEMIRRIRADAKLAHIPAIFISGRPGNEEPILASGGTAFLLKASYHEDDLAILIRRLAAQVAESRQHDVVPDVAAEGPLQARRLS